MFDVGFSELMVIAVVALVVIGPERLPKVARTLGHLFGRLQRYVNDVKADISREMELDELRKFKTQFEEAAHSVESSVRSEMQAAESSLNAVASDANAEIKELTDAVAPPSAPQEPPPSDAAAAASPTPAAPEHEDAGAGAPQPAASAQTDTAAAERKSAAA